MKKIGILTFYNAKNYGAALQAYALQQQIKAFGRESEFIRFIDNINSTDEKLKGIRHYIRNFRLVNYRLKNYFLVRENGCETQHRFNDFVEHYMNISRQSFSTVSDLKREEKNYAAFVTGSDMVWSNIGQNLEAYFLQFTKSNKRLSYAPSLTGRDQESEEEREQYKKYIDGIAYLSCREQYGVDYIKRLTGREAKLVVDPTLLLDADEWINSLELKKNTNCKPYILCYMFNGEIKYIQKNIERIAKNKGYDIRYVPMSPREVLKEIKRGVKPAHGPKEFVELFYNASFVCTNSFHGLLFSLIMNKQFFLFHRGSCNEWVKHEERMTNILQQIGLEDRFIFYSDLGNGVSDEIDYSDVNVKIERLRTESKEYLQSALDSIIDESFDEEKESVNRINQLSADKCTGCSTCVSVCHQKAITMISSEEGFLYPQIDEAVCNNCQACSKKCPALNSIEFKYPIRTYMGFGKQSIVKKSASGGIFVTVAKYLMDHSRAVVFGAAYNEDFSKVEHIAVKDSSELRRLQNSKYVQSFIGISYLECKRYLDSGKTVLFSGTPCQIAGLKTYLGKSYERLYTIDIICHGVPSPEFYSKWIEAIKIEHGNNIKDFSFRHKDKVELRSAFETKIEYDNKVVYESNLMSPYYALFSSEDIYRESCYSCKYAREERISDITIGDCDSWRIYPDFKPEESKSSIMINTAKGIELWESLNDMIEYCDMDYEQECRINHQLRRPSVRKTIRNTIYQDVNSMSWKELIDKYGYKKPKCVKRIAIVVFRLISKR